MSRVLYALLATARRTVECLTDPIRRIHLLVECALVWSVVAVVTGDMLAGLQALGGYFVLYEYLLEPISKGFVRRGWPSLVGPYFERGPQDGERFIHE